MASIIRHVHLQSGIDLAIFDQAIWHYSRFEAPFSSIKGENLLGDHFHPLIALLAPLYWIWVNPRMLLIAQAVLVAASIVPVYLFAQSKVGRGGAYALAGAYAAFWGIQVGVLFDFHEVAFAPLLIAVAVLLADRQSWGWFWLTIAGILCIKEDLSFLVIFFGIYLLTQRRVGQGVALVAAGAGWYELVTRVFIPHFSGGVPYAYWTYGELGRNPAAAIWGLISAPWRIITIGLSPIQKAHTLAALFAPFLFLSLLSPLIIVAVPLLAERFLSTNVDFWSTHFHYSMAIAPVLAMAAASGLANLTRILPARRQAEAIILGAATMLLASLLITWVGASASALSSITRAGFYRAPSYAAPGLRALAHVPNSASLATTDSLLPHASERDHVVLLNALTAGRTNYLIVNVLHIDCCGATGNKSYAALGAAVNQALASLTPSYYSGGWLVAYRPSQGARATNGVLEPMDAQSARKVNHAIARWQTSLITSGKRLGACEQQQAAGQARRGCFSAAVAGAAREDRVLRAAIREALVTLSGGCSQLARSASSAVRLVSADVGTVAAATAASRRAGTAAFASLQTKEAHQDRVGSVERFAILCTPRPG